LAGVVVATLGYALNTPFLADEVGEGLRVFGGVGGQAVSADALVSEVVSIAGIGSGCR